MFAALVRGRVDDRLNHNRIGTGRPGRRENYEIKIKGVVLENFIVWATTTTANDRLRPKAGKGSQLDQTEFQVYLLFHNVLLFIFCLANTHLFPVQCQLQYRSANRGFTTRTRCLYWEQSTPRTTSQPGRQRDSNRRSLTLTPYLGTANHWTL